MSALSLLPSSLTSRSAETANAQVDPADVADDTKHSIPAYDSFYHD